MVPLNARIPKSLPFPFWIWIWMIICKAPTGQYADGLETSLRARRHQPTLEAIQGVGLCHRGRKLIPLFHGAKHELVP